MVGILQLPECIFINYIRVIRVLKDAGSDPWLPCPEMVLGEERDDNSPPGRTIRRCRGRRVEKTSRRGRLLATHRFTPRIVSFP